MQGLRKVWKSKGEGERGVSRDSKPFIWESSAFIPEKNCSDGPTTGNLSQIAFLFGDAKRKTEKTEKNSSVFILDKNLGHMTLLSLGVSHKCCCTYVYLNWSWKKECPHFSHQTLGWLLQAHQNKNCSRGPKSHSKS